MSICIPFKMEDQSKLSIRKKMDVKKRKKDLEKQNSEYKQGIKKRKHSAKDRLLQLNSFYANGNFGIWIQCTKCDKWRKVMEYEEEYEVPGNWCCSMSLSGIRSCDEPENLENVNFSPVNFIPGTIVWAKYNGYPWWPGMIEDDPDTEEYYWKEKNGKWLYNVTFLDDKVTRAWVSASSVRSFLDKPKNKYLTASYAKYSSLLASAEVKAEKAMNMSIQERLKNFSFAHQYKGKWGSPLALNDSEEEEKNGVDITKMLLEEIIDIESPSVETLNLDNKSTSCLELKQNESDHDSVYEMSSTSDFEYEMNGKKKEKPLIDVHSEVNNQDNVANLEIENDNVIKKGTDETANTSIMPKGKKIKSSHVKLEKKSTSESNNDISILDKADADENGKNASKSKKSNKKVKSKKDNKIDTKEEGRSITIKTVSEDVKKFNENEKRKDSREKEILNHSLNSKFKPPVKNNETNACEDKKNSTSTNDSNINLDNSESSVNEETILKKEKSEKNLEENKNRNKMDNKGKKTSKKLIMSGNKSIEKKKVNDNELKENIVKVLEKNLKNSLENIPVEENNEESKKNQLKEDFDNSNISDNKNYTKKNKSSTSNIQQKKITKNTLKIDSTEDTTNIGKRKIGNAFKIPARQNINKKESKELKNLKTEKLKKETEETTLENGFAYESDEEAKKDISCNDFTEEKFSLTVEMNMQETEDDEDSDPFEAE